MKFVSHYAALVALWVTCAAGVASGADFPQKWVFASADVTSDEGLTKSIKDLQQYKALSVTHLLLHEARLGRIQLADAAYAVRARQYQDEAQKAGIALVPAVYALNGAAWLRLDGNLAAGIPARDIPFLVRDGKASVDPTTALPVVNGGFEEANGDRLNGWDGQELAGKNTFVDTTVKHSGKSSLRITAGKASPISVGLAQDFKVKPFQYYRMSVWVKSDGVQAEHDSYVRATSSGGKRGNIWTSLGVSPTQDWTRHCITFNTMEGTDLHFTLGVGDMRSGTIWYDDLTIEPAGLLGVLRRDLCPLKVTSEDGAVTYEEGKDFRPVADPIVTLRPGGLPTLDHQPPKIVLTDNSRIKEGQKLLVSFFHSIRIYLEKEIVSLEDPKTLELMDTQMKLVSRIWPTGAYFMEYDEIRIAGWEGLPDGRHLKPGELLAWHLTKGIEIARKYVPDAKLYTWSDMFTPYHNAQPFEKGGYYYAVNGTWEGSWVTLPKDVIIMNWYAPTKDSMKFFSDRGNAQIMCGYYDGRSEAQMKENIEQWMQVSQGVPNVLGMMYTTWTNTFEDMPPFFKLLADYPKWSTGQAGPGRDR